MSSNRSSRLPGFYKLPLSERRRLAERAAGLQPGQIDELEPGLTIDMAEELIENVVGLYALPMGLATNFLIDGREV